MVIDLSKFGLLSGHFYGKISLSYLFKKPELLLSMGAIGFSTDIGAPVQRGWCWGAF
jgi:hypothetical protein